MKSMVAVSLCFLFAGAAEASLYRLDLSKVAAGEREMVQESCLSQIRVDSSRSMEAGILSQLMPKRMSTEKIEASKSILSTDANDAYTGEVRTSVYLVKVDGFGSYLPFIAKRVEINRYAQALQIRVELLNHRDSAELAEDSVCSDLSYLLVDGSR